MKVKWRLENTCYHDDITGEVEVEDDSTNEEIEKEVREDMWNTMTLTWEIEDPIAAEREADVAMAIRARPK